MLLQTRISQPKFSVSGFDRANHLDMRERSSGSLFLLTAKGASGDVRAESIDHIFMVYAQS